MTRLAWLATVLGCVLLSTTASGQIVVRGDLVYTMASAEPITDGVVLINADGIITAVGPASTIPIPADVRVIRGAVVVPGLVDAHATVGLTGIYNSDEDQDQIERSEPIQPELRALDAYNTRERLVEWVRSFGVTTLHTGHAPGELVSGQTIVVKTTGSSVEDAVVLDPAAIAVTLGERARKEEGSPGTRGKMMAMLRSELIAAQAYGVKMARGGEKTPDRNLRLEALGRALEREVPLLITVNRSQDISTALRLAEEFDLRLILDSAAESYLLIDAIRDAGAAVVIHPSMARAVGEMENMSFETAAKLRAAGIPVAIQSGYESYVPKVRVVLLEAAVAAANGLSFEQALGAITIDAATILGVDDRVGSLEVGKDGDVAIYDGDPFEYTTHCTAVVIEGVLVSDTLR